MRGEVKMKSWERVGREGERERKRAYDCPFARLDPPNGQRTATERAPLRSVERERKKKERERKCV